jgi:DNA-directed RNA polymerase specialized sigma24 family protein
MTSPMAEPKRAGQGRFPTTAWHLVLAVDSDSSVAGNEAFAALCRSYWHPIYAYIRQKGFPIEEAQDLTQEFFVRVLEKGYFNEADPARGRFRYFLLTAINHFLSNQRDRERAQKRGGGRIFLSLEMEEAENHYRRLPVDNQTPEKIYEKQWTVTILESVMTRLRTELEQEGRSGQFDRWKPFLAGEQERSGYGQLAAACGMTEAAARVAVHRMRRRYQQLLRDQIAQTLAQREEIEDEIRYLLKALQA